jgi:hypothetical protein
MRSQTFGSVASPSTQALTACDHEPVTCTFPRRSLTGVPSSGAVSIDSHSSFICVELRRRLLVRWSSLMRLSGWVGISLRHSRCPCRYLTGHFTQSLMGNRMARGFARTAGYKAQKDDLARR